MPELSRGISYTVGTPGSADTLPIEIKNTFLNIPGRLFAPTSSQRRASSCPLPSSTIELPRAHVLAVTKDQRKAPCKEELVSPSGSTDCGSSGSWESILADSPIGQWADYDCSQSLGVSVLESSCSVEEKGAYITGEGDHQQWYEEDSGKGSSQLKWSRNACLVLRGLPFSATECDVANFLEQCGVLGNLAPGRPIKLLVNAQGRLSGFAEVHTVGAAEAEEARAAIHMRQMGNRYIEVLPHAPKWQAGFERCGGKQLMTSAASQGIAAANCVAGSPTSFTRLSDSTRGHGAQARENRNTNHEGSRRRGTWGAGGATGGQFSSGQAAWSSNWRSR